MVKGLFKPLNFSIHSTIFNCCVYVLSDKSRFRRQKSWKAQPIGKLHKWKEKNASNKQ